MSSFKLNAESRTTFGSNAVKKMRRDKIIPAQIYGQGKPNLHIAITVGDAERAIQSKEPLYEITVGSEKRTVLVKEVQRDPIKGSLQHIDFYEVAMDRPVDTRVALVLTGEGERESDGGIVNLVMRELAISCLPNQIPESIVVDVSKLALGDTLLVKDLEIPEGITVNHDPEEVVVTVNAPRAAAEAAEPAEEAEEAAPEGAPEAAEQAADGEA